MTALLFKLLLVGCHLLARLPWRLRYWVSDLIYVVGFRLFGAERSKVDSQLAACFPGWSQAKRTSVRRAYFRHLTDFMTETLSLVRLSHDEARRMMPIDGLASMLAEVERGHSVLILGGHLFNWEIAGRHLAEAASVPVRIVYMPQPSPVMDRLFRRLRAHANVQLISLAEGPRRLLSQPSGPSITVLLADQRPEHSSGDPARAQTQVFEFLNRRTEFVLGPAFIARQLGAEVYLFTAHRRRRHRYEGAVRKIAGPEAGGYAALMDTYVRKLDACIQSEPENWLWSHERW